MSDLPIASGCTCGCCDPVPVEDRRGPAVREVTCYCPVDEALEVIGRKYAMQILAIVGAAERARFKDVEARLPGASTSTLSKRLEELADAGLLDRRSFDEIPPRVEYTLTDEGRRLKEAIEPLRRWARQV